MFFHNTNRLFSYLSDSSPPSRMTKTDDFFYRIYKIKRNTICIRSDKTNPRHVCHKTIYVCIVPFANNPFSFIFFRDNTHICRMCLAWQDHIVTVCSDCRCDPLKIFHDGIFVIPSVKTKVHRLITAFAHSADPCRKSAFYNSRLFK